MKKVWSILCACAMIIGMMPMVTLPVFAATSGDFKYEVLEAGTVEITDYTGSATDLTIPSTLDGYTVTSIGYKAFYCCKSLQSINIPDGVTSIGDDAFHYCKSLQNINISDSLTSIGEVAFSDTAFYNNDANWTNGVLYIGNYLLYAKRNIFGSYTIKQGTKVVADSAFSECESLESITIPDSVTSIGGGAFNWCFSLQSVTIPDSVTSMGNWVFSYCKSLQSITIGNSVTSVGNYAFYYCKSLQSINIPDGVTSIGNYAFYCCKSLQSINIPDGVTSIGDDAFCYCGSLQSITIPDSVTSIGNCAFYCCNSFESITIPNSVTSIGERAFYDCAALTAIKVNDGNTAYCDVNGVLFSKDKKTLIQYPTGESAASYSIPNSVTSIGSYAFSNCDAFQSVMIPNSVKSIKSWAFYGCERLKSITIGNSVTGIGSYAFSYCDALQSIIIPNSVKSIGRHVFSRCKSLESIIIPNSVKSMGELVDPNYESFVHVYYGGSKEEAAKLNADPEGVLTWHYNCPFAKITDESKTASYAVKDQYASAKVTATGDGLSYTWYAKDPGDTQYYKSGAATDTYKLKMTEANSGRLAYCVVTDSYGNNVCSKTFVLRMKATVTAETATASYASKDQYASAKVTATGDGLTYTWYVRDKADTKYYKSSITANTYKAKMTATTSGRLAYCIVRDKYGNKVQSKTFVLRMKATVTSEPATSAYAKKGAPASIKIGAAGDGLSYIWYIKNAGGSKYIKSSVTSATYKTTMNSQSKNRLAYCVVKDKYGKSAKSKTFILREAVSITTQPKNVYAKNGATAKVTLKASGDGLSYTWYVKDAGKTTYSKSSVTKATYSATMSSKSKNRLLYCVVKDKYGKTVKSTTVQLKMK